jgi:hypothetical protein
MKSLYLVAGTAFLGVAIGAGCTAERDALNQHGNYPAGANAPYMTGSYLPQNVNRNGAVTDGRNNVRVLDRSDIDRSGGADLRQSLRLQGVTP